MNDHDAPAPRPDDDLPPIPDGGLGKGLPSWLETPPSRPVKLAGEPAPIDLGTIATGVQIPQWLQDIAVRVDQGEPPDDDAGEGAPQDQVVADPVEQPDVADMPAEPAPEPPVIVPPPVEARPAESLQSDAVTPEARPPGVYILIALAVIIIAVLAAWLIWA